MLLKMFNDNKQKFRRKFSQNSTAKSIFNEHSKLNKFAISKQQQQHWLNRTRLLFKKKTLERRIIGEKKIIKSKTSF